jgi:Holliday junction resolvase
VSLLRVAGGLDRELVDCLDGKGDAGDRANAALVGCGRALPDVVVVGAVDLVVELVAAGTVEGAR